MMKKLLCYIFGHRYNFGRPIGNIVDKRIENGKFYLVFNVKTLSCSRCGDLKAITFDPRGCFSINTTIA